jgi:GWxTD domain-containing protein
MNYLNKIIITLLSLFVVQAFSQYLSTSKLSGIGLPYFHAGIFRTFNQESEDTLGLVRVYFQIINDDLTFIRAEDTFVSDVEFDIYMSNVGKDFVFNRTVNKEIIADTYEETNSRQIVNTFTTDIPLKPDKYDVIITALDKNNNKKVNRKINFEIYDISFKEFLLSDILFFQEYETDSLDRVTSFNPNLTNNFSGKGKYFYFYFVSLQKNPEDTLKIEYTIRNQDGVTIQYNQYNLVNKSPFNEHYVRINRHQFDQSRYQLEIKGIYKGDAMSIRKRFSFYWTENPESPKDLDNALEQMRYILEADSIGWAMKQNYEEKIGYFTRFWRRMDPNPDTEKNELMEEYYLRVNMANQTFSTLSQDGWHTDQGRIFIKFGEPDDIERHPFEIDSQPYEVWRYYTLRKVFIFLDRTGFGDYYLHPAYLDEEFN